MNSIEITAFTTLEINGTEYDAEVLSTVYPAIKADENEPAELQRIDIDKIKTFVGLRWNVKTYWPPFVELYEANLTRCLLAVQNKIDKLV